MASTTATWSPSSLQLRLAFNCKKSPAVLVWTRVRKLDRPFRLFCVVENGARNESAIERTRNGTTWAGSDSTVDGFSGWSESDGGEEDIDSQRKKWFGGFVGMGVAGLILVTGISFAAFSISKQNSSRHKKEMEALTTQQEVSLASDEQSDRFTGDGKEDNVIMKDDSSQHGMTGSITYEDSYLSPDHALVDDVKTLSYGGDDIKNDSIQADLQFDAALIDKSVAPEDSSSLDFPEADVVGDSYVASSSKDSNGDVAVDIDEPDPEIKEIPFNVKPISLPASDVESSNFNTDNLDETPILNVNESFDFSEPTSSSSTGYKAKEEAIALDYMVNSQINTVLLGLEELPKDDLDYVALSSAKEHLVLGKSEQPPAVVPSVSSTAEYLGNEPERDGQNVMNKTASELPVSGNVFSSAGIPAPTVSAAVQALPGKVLIPAVVDQVQGQAVAALQVLKVIEADVQPSDLCTRRDYARWLVSSSSALSRNTISKVYPAMYIENVTELAFDDITPEDPDFPSIQGLAEAGLISSKLSRRDMLSSLDEDQGPFYFSPASPLSRQDLVSWKMALEKRQLPEADRKILHKVSGFIDIDRIHPDACPALVADLSLGEQGIIALAFGYTRLFQPDKPVTKAQAAIALSTGEAADIVSEELARIEAESIAENAVAAHSALVAQVEKDVNASFEKELSIEREKIDAVEKMAEEARKELERLRSEREKDQISLMKERATVESEMEVLSRLRSEVEQQLQSLMSNKVEISYEKERISKLRKEAEIENQEITRLQYELDVERKALSMARAWAEDEAKKAREQAKALEEARDRWERHGIKVVVDDDLREQESAGVTWLEAGKQYSVEGTVNRAENLMDKLKAMAADLRGKSRDVINIIIQKIASLISNLKQWASNTGKQAEELKNVAVSKASRTATELQQSTSELSSVVKERTERLVGDCREGVEKLAQKFWT